MDGIYLGLSLSCPTTNIPVETSPTTLPARCNGSVNWVRGMFKDELDYTRLFFLIKKKEVGFGKKKEDKTVTAKKKLTARVSSDRKPSCRGKNCKS